MGQTATLQLPYPEQAEVANIPVDMKELCDRLEVVFVRAGLSTGDLVWSVLTTRPGAVACDGTLYNSVTDTTFAPLFAAIGTTYGGTGASSFAVPDVRGRLLVCKGTHADVNALGGNDGSVVANRTPKHNSTNGLSFSGAGGNTGTVSSDHSHAVSGTTSGQNVNHVHYGWSGDLMTRRGAQNGSIDTAGGGAADWDAYTNWNDRDHSHTFSAQTGGISANHTHAFTPTGTIAGTIGPGGTRPTDMPAYIVENCFIVK